MITKQDVLQLSHVHDDQCLSIFIPTHRAGQAPLQGEDAIRLKNELKGVHEKLEQQGLKPREIKDLLGQVEDLLDDKEFWRHQSDGLAIFISSDVFELYHLPISFEAFHYVSNDFYLRPLMPIFNGDGVYYLLALTQGGIQFYEATRHTITPVDVKDLVPNRLEDSVGYDHEDRGLQFRSQQGNRGSGQFHGQGDEDDKEKEELHHYFQEIDKGLMKWLHDKQDPPMVLVCFDHYYPLYEKVNTYQNLFPKHVSGNPDDMDELLMHEKSWKLVAPYFDRQRKERVEEFSQYLVQGKASSNLQEIMQAGLEGRIETLFLENRKEVYGVYNPTSHKVKQEDKESPASYSLTNEVAKMTFAKGGTVYLLDADEMPDGNSTMNAIFRYSHEG